MKRFLLAALLASTCAACGGDGDGDGNGNVTRSCNFADEDYCDVASGTAVALDGAGLTQLSCEESGGVFGNGCSATDRVGRCAITVGGVTLTEHYYPPLFNATTAAAVCAEVGGVFTPN